MLFLTFHHSHHQGDRASGFWEKHGQLLIPLVCLTSESQSFSLLPRLLGIIAKIRPKDSVAVRTQRVSRLQVL